MTKSEFEGIRGKVRALTTQEIGVFVRTTRESFGMKRAALAQDVNVTEKTIERVELGVGVSEATYRRIALAFGLKEDAFLQPTFVPASPEDAREVLRRHEASVRRENTSVAVEHIDSVRPIIRLFGMCALICDDSRMANGHLEQVAALKENLQDWSDVSGDIPETERLRAARMLLEEIQQIENLGYVAKAGVSDKYCLDGGTRFSLGVLVFFEAPKGPRDSTPETVWLPKRLSPMH